MLHQLPYELGPVHHLDVLTEMLIVLCVLEDPAVHWVETKLLQRYRRMRDVFDKARLRLGVEALCRIVDDWGPPQTGCRNR